EELGRAGYRPVNFFTFTKGGGYVQRYFAMRWGGVDVYAFGSSAFGSLANWGYQNTTDIGRYSEMLEQGELPIFRGYVYDDLELMTREVLLGMKLVRFDRRAFKERHGLDVVRLCGTAVRRLEDEGFVTVDDAAIELTSKGILYGDHAGRVMAAELEK